MKTPARRMTGLAAVAVVGLSTQSSSVRAANVAEVAMSAPQFSTLVKAVKAAGLAKPLMNTKNITVFAPTNAAFAKLPKGTLAMLLKPENKATLAKILMYHVVPMRVSAKKAMSLPSGAGVNTLANEKFSVRKMNGVTLDAFGGGKAKVIKTDIKADNGILHAIDSVILPPSVVRAMAAQKAGM